MIYLTRGKANNLEGEYSVYISFDYDKAILDKVKELPTRRYDPDTKKWEVPEWDIQKVLKAFESYVIGIELVISKDVDLEATKPLSDYEIKVLEGGAWTLFSDELGFIRSDEIREFAIDLLGRVPSYFFSVPASSSGKYHPQYALGEGGLVRHTKAAMKIANEILNNNTMCGSFTDTDRDIVLVALLFHDCLKHGGEDEAKGHTIFDHPTVASVWIDNMYKSGYTTKLDVEILDKILDCIESHMGEWNKPYKGDELELPLPKNKLQKITHLADYLASRKFLEVSF